MQSPGSAATTADEVQDQDLRVADEVELAERTSQAKSPTSANDVSVASGGSPSPGGIYQSTAPMSSPALSEAVRSVSGTPPPEIVGTPSPIASIGSPYASPNYNNNYNQHQGSFTSTGQRSASQSSVDRLSVGSLNRPMSDAGSQYSSRKSKSASQLREVQEYIQRRDPGVFLEVHPLLRKIGFNPNASEVEEVDEMINFIIFARIVQFITLLVAFSCISSVHGKLNVKLQNLEWFIAIGVLGWLMVSAHGVLAYIVLGQGTKKQGMAVVYLGFWGDLFFVFMTLSAFSAVAPMGDFSSTTTAGLVFMFLSWILFLYTAPLSFFVYKDRKMLYLRLEQVVLQSDTPPALQPQIHTTAPPPTVVNV